VGGMSGHKACLENQLGKDMQMMLGRLADMRLLQNGKQGESHNLAEANAANMASHAQGSS
jgi:hypothetical protein